MKTLKYFMMLIFLAGMPLMNAYAQEELAVPEEPREPRYGRHHVFELSAETEKEYLKNFDAELKKDLIEMKKQDKEKYFELLMESGYGHMRIPYLDDNEKEVYERSRKISDLEVRTEVLAFKYEKASNNEKQNIKNELRKKLVDLFELREKDRQYQIGVLEKELRELKASIDMRKNNKEIIISRRLQELLGEDKYLDWD